MWSDGGMVTLGVQPEVRKGGAHHRIYNIYPLNPFSPPVHNKQSIILITLALIFI